MSKCIGLDVGGTFTDIVLVDGERIVSTGKTRTDTDNILQSLLDALDSLEVSDVKSVDRITVSTTLVTNAIIEEKLPLVEVILFPGSGLRPESFEWPFSYHVCRGEMDFRGHVIQDADPQEWGDLVKRFKEKGLPDPPLFCIVGKFSHHNRTFEEQLAAYLLEEFPQARFALGHQWGQINFYRRAQTSYLNLATHQIYRGFSQGLLEAIRARGYQAPISVLKANGGVLPIDKAIPVQTIYSGPAASVLGALTQTKCRDSFFVVDIGGTTTDIGVVLSGVPLASSQGARIGAFTTNVHSLAVRSVPVGGDSTVNLIRGQVSLSDHRLGSAYCLGGPALTPTDAMRYLQLTDYGDWDLAEEALLKILPPEERLSENVSVLAENIISEMTKKICEAMDELHHEWEDEPAYKVWHVLNQGHSRPFYLHLSGGSAPALRDAFLRDTQLDVELAQQAHSTNALGSALARPSFTSTLHLDTLAGIYRIVETGEKGSWSGSRRRPHDEVVIFLREIMEKRAHTMGLTITELVQDDFSFFPQIEDNKTVGQIVRGSMHMPIGVRGRIRK